MSQALHQQITFLREMEKLKCVLRGNKTLDGRFENTAEHSWHVTLMALLLEEHANSRLDMLKVTKLLLIHDIVEIDAGDTWLYDADQTSKLQDETHAAHRLFSLLPSNQKKEYLDLWLEFENRSTDEAKFAAAIDGLQPLINHLITGDPDDFTIPADLVLSKKSHIQAFAPSLWPLVEALVEESTELGLYGQ